MSGIFGIVDPRGDPVVATLTRMREAMAYWGPDGGDTWTDGPAGLGHLKLMATAEAAGERLPFQDPDSGLIFTASARLDDRDELLGALEVPHVARPATADTMLLLRAWLRWGENGLARLGGDWSFALWDPREQRLVLARDPYGQTALYHTCSPGGFAFASSQKALLALPDLPREIDDLWLAQVLIGWYGDGTATALRSIRRLPPAHLLTWRDGRLEIRQYWRMEDVGEIRLGSDEAYEEAFLEHYTRAVRRRLRGARPAGVTLSGGLDSGSVTALAARELRESRANLVAFTSVPLHAPDGAGPNRFGDEWPYAHAVADLWPNIIHVPIPSADCTPLEGIDRQLWINDEPGLAPSAFYWITALMEAARDRGLGVLLTGQMGNVTVSFFGSRYRVWERLRSGDLARAGAELAAWRRENRLSWPRTVRSQIGRPLLEPLLSRWRDMQNRGSPTWQPYSAIHPEFARRLRLGRLMREAGFDPDFSRLQTPLAERLSILEPGRVIIGAIWHEIGAAYGMEVRDPTVDLRLLQFCLGIPDDQFSRLGRDRWLLRRAFEGLLPREVLWNRRRGLQAADLGHRLNAQADLCREWLDSMERSRACRERLDLPHMRRTLQLLGEQVSPASTSKAMCVLGRGLCVGRYLLRQEALSDPSGTPKPRPAEKIPCAPASGT